jgi:hypothetical protein
MRHFYSPTAIRASAFFLLLLPALTTLAQKLKPPQDGIRQVFHPVGKYLILEEFFKDGLRHGPSRQFDRLGLIRDANYSQGKLDGFWREYEQGNLVSETNYIDGKPEGPTFVRRKDYEMNGQYLNGKPEGLWSEKRPGRWEFVKRYKGGLPHGIWERLNKDRKEDLRLTYDEGKLVTKTEGLKNLPYLQKVSALAKDENDLLAKRALAALEMDVDLEYSETPAKEVIDDLKERFHLPIYLDIQAADVASKLEAPITINEKKVELFLGLYEIAAEHELIFDYRFHSFWLTSPKALAAWKDTTGVSDLKPADGNPLAKALPEPPNFDLLATPIANLAEPLQKEHGITLDASRTKNAEWHQGEQRPFRGMPQHSLRDSLFITLYMNHCCCRQEGGKLIIEPLEKKP